MALKRGLDVISTSSCAGQNKVFKRNFEHVDGNWASHVYLPVKANTKLKHVIHSATSSIKNELSNLYMPMPSPLPLPLPLLVTDSEHHISLSKVFILRAHQIESFVAKLSKSVQQCLYLVPKLTVKVSSNKYIILCNDEHTRLFQCLLISKHVTNATDTTSTSSSADDNIDDNAAMEVEEYTTTLIIRLIREAIDPVLTSFLSRDVECSSISTVSSSSASVTYYEDPIVHVSVGSVPLHQLQETSRQRLVEQTNRHILPISNTAGPSDNDSDSSDDDTGAGSWGQAIVSDATCLQVQLFCIECKIGNRIFRINLNKLNEGFKEIFN